MTSDLSKCLYNKNNDNDNNIVGPCNYLTNDSIQDYLQCQICSDEMNYKQNIWSCAIDICEPFVLKLFFAVREYDLNEPTRLLYGLNLLGFYMG